MTRKTRRAFVRDAGLATVLLTGGGLATDPATAGTSAEHDVADAGDDWPMFHGTPARTGFTSTSGPTGDPFAQRFSEPIPDISSDPCVVDGVVYYVEHDSTVVAFDPDGERTLWQTDVTPGQNPWVSVEAGTVYILGQRQGTYECLPVPPTLIAIDASDGSIRWKHEFDASGAVGPTVVDGTSYVIAGGLLVAIAADGSVAWETQLPEYVSELPAVRDGLVVTAGPNTVVAIDASDGSEAWRQRVLNPEYPTIADGTVYVVSSDDLVALDLADGSRRWRTTTTDREFVEISRAPAAGNGRVYAMTDEGYVVAFSMADGSREWDSTPIGEGDISVGPETVYVGVMRYFDALPTVYALDASDGSVRWQHPVRDMHPSETPVLADGTLFFGGDSLTTLSTDHPRVQWRETVTADDGSVQTLGAPPVVTADTVTVAGTETGYQPGNSVVAIDRSTRERRWSYDIGEPVLQEVRESNGTIVAGTDDGIVALDEASGDVQWEILDDGAVTAVKALNVLDDTVFAAINQRSPERMHVAAFDLAAGDERWRFYGVEGEAGNLYGIGDLYVGDDQVFLIDSPARDDGLVALDAETGEMNWNVANNWLSQEGVGDGVVFTEEGELVARSAADGSVQWRTTVSDDYEVNIDSVGVTSVDGTVFVPTSVLEGKKGIAARSLADGSARWSNSLDQFEGSHTAPPVYAGGTVYLSYGRQVLGLDAADGTVRDRYVSKSTVGGVEPRADAVYVADEAGHLTAIDPFE